MCYVSVETADTISYGLKPFKCGNFERPSPGTRQLHLVFVRSARAKMVGRSVGVGMMSPPLPRSRYEQAIVWERFLDHSGID